MRDLNNKQFLGNIDKDKMEVHDLDNTFANCQVNEIKEEHKKYFDPDTLKKAHKEKFDDCAYCIGNSKH